MAIGDYPTVGDQLGRYEWKQFVEQKVSRRLQEQDLEYFVAEIAHWKQKCEELELEILMLENSYPDENELMTVNPKHRGLF
jgi:hypothetical protein